MNKFYPFLLITLCCSCSTANLDKLSQQVSQLNNRVRIQEDRIKELEQSQVQLNERLERSEFKSLSYKNDAIERVEAESQLIDSTYGQNNFEPESTTSLDVKIANQTSSLVPLKLLDQHRLAAEELPPVIANSFIVASQEMVKNKFLSATLGLQEFAKQELNPTWSARAEFWLGVAAEGMKEYRKAVAYYSNLLNSYPEFESLPLALYRQGNLFSRIGESELAKLSYQQIIKDFPDSNEAALAQRLIDP